MAGTREGSLLGTIDRTVTAAGARLLADDLASPLTDKGAILDRLDLVDALARDALWRGELRATRSEEHTSELQSLMRISYAVFCLKKKNNPVTTQNHCGLHIHTLT